jgi:hypothetical protein
LRENIPELKPLTRYWYDPEKGEVVAICESRKPPREGLALVVTNIYGETGDMTLEREPRRNPAR